MVHLFLDGDIISAIYLSIDISRHYQLRFKDVLFDNEGKIIKTDKII